MEKQIIQEPYAKMQCLLKKLPVTLPVSLGNFCSLLLR